MKLDSKSLNSDDLYIEEVQNSLRSLSLKVRENVAFSTRTMVKYFDAEVEAVQRAEMNAAL